MICGASVLADDVGQKSEHDEFYTTYGSAMLCWGVLENIICGLFIQIAKLDPTIGRSIYYSSRSFQGRMDLLESVIPFISVSQKPKMPDFVKAARKKAGAFSSFRNKLAHSQITYIDVPASRNYKKLALVDGSKQSMHDLGFNSADIANAWLNFSNLTQIIYAVSESYYKPQTGIEVECLWLLKHMPNLAHVHNPNKEYQDRLNRVCKAGLMPVKL